MAKNTWGLLRDTYRSFSEDRAVRLGAALSYYTIFSLPPLLVLTISIASIAFGEEAAKGNLLEQFRDLVGDKGVAAINTMIANAARPEHSIPATIIGVSLLVLGAMGVFVQLQEALNTIWEVKPKPVSGLKATLGRLIMVRLISLVVVVSLGFLLLVSLVVSAALSAFSGFLRGLFPWPEYMVYLLQAVDIAVSLGVISLLFAVIFKVLPDAEVSWRDVWTGALATAVLFTVGKIGIGLYLGRSTAASVYGAAGSLVIILLWVFYSSNILLFGAEFTRVYANRFGSKIRPASYAEPLTPLERAQQGMKPEREDDAA